MGNDRENPLRLIQFRDLNDELFDALINLRTSAGLTALRQRDLITMGDQIAFPRSRFEQLRPNERRLLQAIVAGKSSRTGILVGRTAARLCGMWVVPLSEEKIEISLPSRSASPSRLRTENYTFRYSKLPMTQVSIVRGIMVSYLIRTFADIARHHGFLEGLIAIDWLRFRGIDLSIIKTGVRDMGRLKGIATVRRCMEHSVAYSDSPYESLGRGLLIQAGITGIEVQVEISGYRVDMLLKGWLVIEIDGAVKYEGPNAERVRQKEFNRQKAIANQGYVFLRYTPADLHRNPAGYVAEVRETLERHPRRLGPAG